MSVYIETHRSQLRPIKASDWELFQRLLSEQEVIALCFDRPSETEIRKKICFAIITMDQIASIGFAL